MSEQEYILPFSEADLRLVRSIDPDLYSEYQAIQAKPSVRANPYGGRSAAQLVYLEERIAATLGWLKFERRREARQKAREGFLSLLGSFAAIPGALANHYMAQEAKGWQARYEKLLEELGQVYARSRNAYLELRQENAVIREQNAELEAKLADNEQKMTEARMDLADERIRLQQETQEERKRIQNEFRSMQAALLPEQFQGLSGGADLLADAIRHRLYLGVPVEGVISHFWGITPSRSDQYALLRAYVTQLSHSVADDRRRAAEDYLAMLKRTNHKKYNGLVKEHGAEALNSQPESALSDFGYFASDYIGTETEETEVPSLV